MTEGGGEGLVSDLTGFSLIRILAISSLPNCRQYPLPHLSG